MVADTTGVTLLVGALSRAGSQARATQLVKLRPSGALRWVHTTLLPQQETYFPGLAADASGTLYVAGSVQGTVTLGGIALRSISPTSGDGVLLSFTAQGNPRWGQVVSSGTGRESVIAVAAIAPDQLHVAGQAIGDAQLGPLPLPATATGSEWLAGRLHLSTLTTTHSGAAPALQLAPNPARAFATLTLPAAPAARAFALLDALGRPVRHYTVPAGATTARLEVAGLPAGLYVLRGAGATRKLVLE